MAETITKTLDSLVTLLPEEIPGGTIIPCSTGTGSGAQAVSVEAIIQKVLGALGELEYEEVYIDITGATLTADDKIRVVLNSDLMTARDYSVGPDNGIVLQIPIGTKYRVMFPDLPDCTTPPDQINVAALPVRNIKVTYGDATGSVAGGATERVKFLMTKWDSGVSTKYKGSVWLSIDGGTPELLEVPGTDGTLVFEVPLGKPYEVTLVPPEGYVPKNNKTKYSLVAERIFRQIIVSYHVNPTGVFLMGEDLEPLSLEEWIASGKTPEEAQALKISTEGTLKGDTGFLIPLEILAERKFKGTAITTRAWCGSNASFSTVPAILASSTGTAYFYDGLGACLLLQDEAQSRGLDIPAIGWCLGQKYTLGGTEFQGFLGALGQMAGLWELREEVDAAIAWARPEATYTFSGWTANKWTCSQTSSAAIASWSFASSPGLNVKDNAYLAIPFFAL